MDDREDIGGPVPVLVRGVEGGGAERGADVDKLQVLVVWKTANNDCMMT